MAEPLLLLVLRGLLGKPEFVGEGADAAIS
jgi:hypothetical protein